MDNLRFVFEIRYNVIFNFSSFYREIIAPYFGYPNASYSISDEGTHKEGIQITFNDSNHFILFRNNRISFQYDGDYRDLKKSGSHIDMLFEIYEKLKTTSSFLSVGLIYAEFISLKTNEEGNTLEKFIENQSLDILTDDVSDFSIIEEGEVDSVIARIEYGPFAGAKRIEQNGLFLIRKQLIEEYKQRNGIYSRVVLKKEVNDLKKSDFKEIVRIYENLIKKIMKL